MRKRKEGFSSSSSSVQRRVNEIKLLFFLKGEIILRANFCEKEHTREKFFQADKRRKKTPPKDLKKRCKKYR